MRVALLLFILVWGCVRSESVQCATGILCPPGHECDDTNNRCLSPEQLLQCAGMADLHPCTVGGVPGECAAGVCEARFCGDGIVSSGESCEGPNLGPATCRDAGYYKPEGLACSSFCTFDVTNCQERCGDGVRNGPELCDYMDTIAPSETCRDIGYDVGYVTCSSGCGFELSGCGRVGWRFMASTVPNEYYGMHASSATNVWAVGEDVQPVRFDGTQWTEASAGAAEDATSSEIYSIEPNLAWLVDNASNVFAFDGTAWSEMTTAPVDAVAVFATAANDVWVATTANNVKRWNGTAWTDAGSLAQSGLTEIDGSGPNDVWVSTSDGTAHHWNGTTWTPATIITGNSPQLRDLWVRSPTEAYAVGSLIDTNLKAFISRWDGITWTSSTTSIDIGFLSISGTGPKDLWVNGSYGPAHFDGATWFAAPYRDLIGTLSQVYSTGTGDTVAVAASGETLRHDGLVYGRFDPPITPRSGATWGTQSGHVFAAALSTADIAHFDGTEWLPPQNAFGGIILGIWGTAHDSVWAVGSAGKPTFFDGTNWTQSTIANTTQLSAVWGSSANDVWVAGEAGTVIHYNGTTWTHRNISGASPATDIYLIAGTGPDDVWALSILGNLYRWNGAWSTVSPPPGTSPIRGLHIRAAGEPMVFRGSRLYRFTAGAWVEESFPLTQSPPTNFVANGPNEMFGLSTTDLFHFDGTRWAPLALPDEMLGKQAYGFGAVMNRRVDIFFWDGGGYMRPLLRIRPWVCTPTETVCNDSVDNDCDDRIDERDSDCP